MDERVSIAPMMEWTDPHYRALMRGFTRKSVLYTEMVVDDTIIHGPTLDFFIGRFLEEQPSVIQLGGHEPEKLAQAAEICEQYGGGYGEINLNCGCPSPRVAKRCFGAKLMLDPEYLREIVYSMQRRVSIPVTVKCRIGADDLDKYEDLTHFIRCASAGGTRKFVVHARKCLLNGLSPKQNREIPPLRYETVHRLVRDFPELTFVLNGGINTFAQAKTHVDLDNKYSFYSGSEEGEMLPAVHGVMIGRAAYTNPAMFATADSEFHGVADPCLTRRQVLEKYIDYCDWVQSDDGPSYTSRGKHVTVTTSVLLNAMRNIMHGLPNQQRFRTALNDVYMEKIKGINGDPNPSVREVIEGAYLAMNEEDIDRPLGNPHAGEDTVKPLHNLGTRAATAGRDYRNFVAPPRPVQEPDPLAVPSTHVPRKGASPRAKEGISPRPRGATGEWDSADVAIPPDAVADVAAVVVAVAMAEAVAAVGEGLSDPGLVEPTEGPSAAAADCTEVNSTSASDRIVSTVPTLESLSVNE